MLLLACVCFIANIAAAQTAPTVFMTKGANLSIVLADKVKPNAKVTVTNMIGSLVYEGRDLSAVVLAHGKYFLKKEDEPHTIVLIAE